jgi:rod shape-determining protein MreC
MIGNVTSLPQEPPQFFRRGPSTIARLTFFGLISFALMFVDSRFKTLEAVRMGIATVVYPIQQIALVPGQAFASMGDFFQSRDSLRAENAKLRTDLLAASVAEQASVAAQTEAKRLAALVGAAQSTPVRSQASRVLYLGRDHYTQKFFINRNADQSFETGAAVIDGGGLLGQITRVHPLLAEVTLLTERDFVVPVRIERTGTRTLLSGRGHGNVPDLPFIASNVDIVEGDNLLTSGIDGLYPPNLRVCKVSRVSRGAEIGYSKIECTPYAGVTSAETVLVLDKPAPQQPRPAVDPANDNGAKKRR